MSVSTWDVLDYARYLVEAQISSGGTMAAIRYCQVALAPETHIMAARGFPSIAIVAAGSEPLQRYLGESNYSWYQRFDVWIMTRAMDALEKSGIKQIAELEEKVRAALDKIATLSGADNIEYLGTDAPRPFPGADGQDFVIGLPVRFRAMCRNC